MPNVRVDYERIAVSKVGKGSSEAEQSEAERAPAYDSQCQTCAWSTNASQSQGLGRGQAKRAPAVESQPVTTRVLLSSAPAWAHPSLALLGFVLPLPDP